jgi:hypothetical protein
MGDAMSLSDTIEGTRIKLSQVLAELAERDCSVSEFATEFGVESLPIRQAIERLSYALQCHVVIHGDPNAPKPGGVLDMREGTR